MKIKTSLLIWTLILSACLSAITTPQPFPAKLPTNTPVLLSETGLTLEFPSDLQTHIPIGPKIIVTVGTPNIGQPPDGNFSVTESTSNACAFSWANKSLEELTDVFDAAIKKLNPNAAARASAFGEDCIYQDGSRKFLAIETDFYIELPVTDLKDLETLGKWMAQTMPFVMLMPADMVEGPQTGYVEYRFTKSESEFLIVRVPIQVYNDSAKGKTGEELFRLFDSTQ
jgi:hypothetical protein